MKKRKKTEEIKSDTINLHEYREYDPPDLDDLWTFQALGLSEIDYVKTYLTNLIEVKDFKDYNIPKTHSKRPKRFLLLDDLIQELILQLRNDLDGIAGEEEYSIYYFFNNEEIYSDALCISACFSRTDNPNAGSIYYHMIVKKHRSRYLIWGFNNDK